VPILKSIVVNKSQFHTYITQSNTNANTNANTHNTIC
jgi:hypothetical protein